METKLKLLDFAMDLERKSIELYQNLSGQTIVKELSKIFQFLAGEEKSHYEVLKAWRDNTDPPVLEGVPFIPDPENIFPKLSEHFNIYGIPATHYYDAYEKARLFEEKSLAFYENLLVNIEEGRKELLLKIIEQEKTMRYFSSTCWSSCDIRENGLKTPNGTISRNIKRTIL